MTRVEADAGVDRFPATATRRVLDELYRRMTGDVATAAVIDKLRHEIRTKEAAIRKRAEWGTTKNAEAQQWFRFLVRIITAETSSAQAEVIAEARKAVGEDVERYGQSLEQVAELIYRRTAPFREDTIADAAARGES